MMTTATLLIGYYHGLLLSSIDADLLTNTMCSTGLLTAHEQVIISTGSCTAHGCTSSNEVLSISAGNMASNWLTTDNIRWLHSMIVLRVYQLLVVAKLLVGQFLYSFGE